MDKVFGGVLRALFGLRIDFFFSSRRRHTRWNCDWSSDVCPSDLLCQAPLAARKAMSWLPAPGRRRCRATSSAASPTGPERPCRTAAGGRKLSDRTGSGSGRVAHGRDFAGGGAAVTSGADGTGRPADLPGRGWWEVLRRVRLALARDHIWIAAAGVAYCTLFAAIPGVTVA